jgi:hypothetical protein
VADPELVVKVHPVDPGVGHVGWEVPLELAVQEVVLEVPAVLVALVFYFSLEEVADPGERPTGIQEEGEQQTGKVQSCRTGTPVVYLVRQ